MNKELQQWEEGNKLIAEFAGWVRVYPGTAPKDNRRMAQFEGPNGGYWASNISDGIGAHVWPSFHSSWDFLMPVVEKISRLEFERRFDGEKWVVWTHHPITFGMLDESGRPMVRFYCGGLHTGDTLIEAAWLAVVGFIESNNSQTQPQ